VTTGLSIREEIFQQNLDPLLPREEKITKEAIRVIPSTEEALHPASRINYGKPYAVEHNVKLFEIGLVAPEHMHILLHYFVLTNGTPVGKLGEIQAAELDQ
jgi:hypothetical protein